MCFAEPWKPGGRDEAPIVEEVEALGHEVTSLKVHSSEWRILDMSPSPQDPVSPGHPCILLRRSGRKASVQRPGVLFPLPRKRRGRQSQEKLSSSASWGPWDSHPSFPFPQVGGTVRAKCCQAPGITSSDDHL